jgi:uncharacterized protein YbcI
MSDFKGGQAGQALCTAISRSVVGIMREYTGRGQDDARTTIRDDVVTVTVPDAMLKGERHLVAGGRAELVEDMRRYIQQTMRGELSAAVETLTGRDVIAVHSQTQLAPDYSVGVFTLASPATSPGP